MNNKKQETTKRKGKSEKSAVFGAENSEMLSELMMRIRQCADLAGSGDALAQKAAIPRRTLETYMAGDAEPKTTRLVAIARAANVNIAWLAAGEGPMRKGEGVAVAPLDHELMRIVIEELEKSLIDVNGYLEPEKKAELVVLLYEEAREQEGKVDRSRIMKLIRLAS